MDKIKAAKKNKNSKKKRKAPSDDDDDDDDDILEALQRSTRMPQPGQLENCAQCGKRFTVTPYSRADASGKLLCTECGKLLDREDHAAQKREREKKRAKARAAATAASSPGSGLGGQRRKTQSRILDGASPLGSKSLVALCIEHLSRNIDLAEDLGGLPEDVVNRIARLLSKRRLVNPRTVDLLIRPHAEEICVYDCADLHESDFLRMLQAMPRLKHLTLYNAIQFKDDVVDYLLQRDKVALESLCLYGANLITDAKWKQYLVEKGQHLRRLQICDTDKHVTDEVLSYVRDCAPDLQRLKIRINQAMTAVGVEHIGHMSQLQHLNLQIASAVHGDVYIKVLSRIGPGLQTLSLRKVDAGVDNAVLAAVHQHCRQLRKLRITDAPHCTDEAFARLFAADWANPPLQEVDLEKNRFDDPDKAAMTVNTDGLGFCIKGFRALMAHSGSELRRLNLHACRHISREAFEEVFAADKVYPELRRMDVSFCGEVTDHIVCCMFRSCPKLRELVTSGCMLVTGVQVPRGRILVGVPNAVGMQTVGQDDD